MIFQRTSGTRGRFQFQKKGFKAEPRPGEDVQVLTRAGHQIIDVSFPPNFRDSTGRLVGMLSKPAPAQTTKVGDRKSKDAKLAEVVDLVTKLMIEGKLGPREALIRAACKWEG